MQRLLTSLLLLWAGILFGVSFVATPAKFLAPSLTLPQALDVGRWTFHVLAYIEWGCLLAAFAVLGAMRRRPGDVPKGIAICLGGIAGLLALQSFWLRPILDMRVLAIMNGRAVPASDFHLLYLALETTKFILVVVAGWITTAGRGSTVNATERRRARAVNEARQHDGW